MNLLNSSRFPGVGQLSTLACRWLAEIREKRTNGEFDKIIRHGPSSRCAEIRGVERKGSQAAPAEPRAPQRDYSPRLLRAGLPGLPSHLQPPSESSTNADLATGLEAAMEVALIREFVATPTRPRGMRPFPEARGITSSRRLEAGQTRDGIVVPILIF